jgi:large subunit ribosomal protein L9e
MRFVYAHFPINAVISDKGDSIEIRNFVGQKVIMKVKMLPGVTVSQSSSQKDELVIVGNDLDFVSQSGEFLKSLFFICISVVSFR